MNPNSRKLLIYEDEELTSLAKALSLGPLKVGEKKRYTYYVYNPSEAEWRDLKFTVEDPEVQVISAPKEILPGKSAVLEFEWSPSITIEEPLKTKIHVRGERWFRPKDE